MVHSAPKTKKMKKQKEPVIASSKSKPSENTIEMVPALEKADEIKENGSDSQTVTVVPNVLPDAGDKPGENDEERVPFIYYPLNGNAESNSNGNETTVFNFNVPKAEDCITIKIDAIGETELLEAPVNQNELVNELRIILAERENTCYRTCFNLVTSEGVSLDYFCEIKNIEGLKKGGLIKQVDDSYSLAEVRKHIRTVKDICGTYHPEVLISSDTGLLNLSWINVLLDEEDIINLQGGPCAFNHNVALTPEDAINKSKCGEPCLTPLYPKQFSRFTIKCYEALFSSHFNPPPPRRKNHGDLWYIVVDTLEKKQLCITACPKGFYLNKCSGDKFDPDSDSATYQTLVELLKERSPSFKKNFNEVIKRRYRGENSKLSRFPRNEDSYAWVVPKVNESNWHADFSRVEDFHAVLHNPSLTKNILTEDFLPFATRDWNDEIQAFRELPMGTQEEKFVRGRSLVKSPADFKCSSIRGAIGVIDGTIPPVNPADEQRSQLFLYNHIFFSLGFDVKDHFVEIGGDAAARVSPSCDLQGLKILDKLDSKELHSLSTSVIDYRGFRVTGQSIIPGILERESDKQVEFGSVDHGLNVTVVDEHMDMFKKYAEELRLAEHNVVDEKGNVHNLPGGIVERNLW